MIEQDERDSHDVVAKDDTMVRHLLIAIACLTGWLLTEFAIGQEPPIHYLHSAMLPPGTVAQGQLVRFPAAPGYFQPIKLVVPKRARVALVVNGNFDEPQSGSATAGMQVGMIYQLKITHIPFHEGAEIYPTIEVLNRLYPPHGQAVRFPVPIEFTQADLELALTGHYVTRVIYLEDPAAALAFADEPDRQRYFDVTPEADPLRAADRLGRPMAIMRMGSRVPELGASATNFAQSPPVQLYVDEPRRVSDTDIPSARIERQRFNIPRAPLR
jgi:hypothetical protein